MVSAVSETACVCVRSGLCIQRRLHACDFDASHGGASRWHDMCVCAGRARLLVERHMRGCGVLPPKAHRIGHRAVLAAHRSRVGGAPVAELRQRASLTSLGIADAGCLMTPRIVLGSLGVSRHQACNRVDTVSRLCRNRFAIPFLRRLLSYYIYTHLSAVF